MRINYQELRAEICAELLQPQRRGDEQHLRPHINTGRYGKWRINGNSPGNNYRHELKYVISEGEHQLLSTRLKACLRQDYYASVNNGEYFIRSLYFDDPFDTADLGKSQRRSCSRDKFRIRIYNHSDSIIKLERKHKEGQYIKKDSVSLSRADCDAFLRGNIECLRENESPFAMQFYGIFKANHLQPKVLVDYTREPYVFPSEDVRITFDKNVRSAMRSTDLFNPNTVTYPVWELRKLHDT